MRPTIALASGLAAAALLSTTAASATNYSLWVHGRNPSSSTQQGNYADFSYWGPATTAAGVNKRAVNWDGRSRISVANYRIRDALDCFCTGANWCYVAGHSAGDPQISYAISTQGGSTRSIKTPGTGSNGVCSNAGGTQTGWNIKWVNIASGASGGSELADLGYWAVSDELTSDLRTATMRALYDHSQTRGKQFYHFAGASGTLYSGILPGQDDEALSYHSTGALSSTGSFCNPGNLFCDGVLQLGTAGSTKGSATIQKWTNHSVSLRDDAEQYNHYGSGNWAGIIGPVRADMVTYAY